MARKHKAPSRTKGIVLVAVAAVLVVVAVAVNVAAGMFSSLLNHYLGGPPSTIETVAGSEDWDTEYYDQQYRGRGRATEDAKALVSEVEGEGIVLLKNDNGGLPLAEGETVSLIGRYAADPVYGGAGSGTVDPDDCTDLYAGLAQAGLVVNDTAYSWIAENHGNYAKADITMDNPKTASYYIGEIPWSDYPAEAQASISGTTAVVVIGRGGGEGGDLSRDLKGDLESGVSENFTANAETANYADGQHELELSREERDLVAAAKAACPKVVVVINASTPIEAGDLMEGPLAVDSIIEVGSLGASGAEAVGKVLTGQVNPSGRTTDIWAADFTADPTFANFGGRRYTDVEGFYAQNFNDTEALGNAYFVEYEEGIYYGYRYYETAAVEAAAGNYAGFDYDGAVVYPFGYGLSYTTFGQTLDSVAVEDGQVTATVTVTNTGDVPGKDVVQVYYSAPYTPGGIEKSAVVLGGFAKTGLLDPGASQTVTVTYPVSDMASYSTEDGCYVQDAGDYVVSLRTNSHDVVAEQTLSLEAATYTEDAATGNPVANRFDDMTSYMEDNCERLSRADFAGTWPVAAADKAAADMGVEFVEYDVAANDDPSAQMPVTGADNGLSLIDMRGKEYDDPAWEDLLDQLSVADMTAMLNDGAYNTAEIGSISKPATHDPDGPAGFTSLTGPTGNCAWCSEYLMAQTWNTELMYQVGLMIGQEALASGYNGWYAPAMNTHRSPFAGRNFEYYSEDPLLGGKMGAAVVSGAAQNGVYAYVKHFALNDQESYRVQHLATWADEQTMREIYLRPFEITVKEASYEQKYIADDRGTVETRTTPACTGMMSSFNFLGTTWAGGSKALLTDILRDEWGFRGMVITDFNLYGYMDKNQAVAAGTDLQLTYSAMTPAFEAADSATVVGQLRTATKNVLYTTANSNMMQGIAPGSVVHYGTATWQYAVWGVTAALVLVACALVYFGLGNLGVIKRRTRDDGDASVPTGGAVAA